MTTNSPPLLGDSASMRAIRDTIARVARAKLPVLIEGETGTGKELVAAAIHAASGRRGRFVAFNVCALPESIFESSVFGHARGAFTGAHADADGLLTEADHGTAFFDEIGTLAPVMQGKLLRALETGSYRPVGARHDRRSDFRIVSAANVNLLQSVDAGLFRMDLAQRLAGCVITLPPLRERGDDIALLAAHFASAVGERTVRFSPEALRMLRAYPWPGNVRELRMFVDRVVLLADHAIVTAGDVKAMLLQPRLGIAATVRETAVDEGGYGAERALAREELLSALRQAQWNTALLARRLGVHRSTLYRRMKLLGLDPPRRGRIAPPPDLEAPSPDLPR